MSGNQKRKHKNLILKRYHKAVSDLTCLLMRLGIESSGRLKHMADLYRYSERIYERKRKQ